MPQISKIRIVNFNYNDGNRFIPDELYDLASPDTGKALNTLFNLNNGGGKTVLVQLMMQPVHPKAMAGGRRIEDYFSHTGDHSYILLEWNLDGSKEKLLTGISIAASSSASTEEDKRGNSVKYYTFTTHYDTFSAYSISSLELSSNDNGNYVPAQFDYVREKAKSSRGLLTYYSSDDAVKWAEFLAEYGIFRTEWESVIEVLNKDEGGLNQYFDEAKTSDKLIAKFFIPAIEQKLMSVASKGTDCSLETMLINYAKKITDKESVIKQRDTNKKLLEDLEGVSEISDDLYNANDAFVANVSETRGFAAALGNRMNAVNEETGRGAQEIEGQNILITRIDYEKKSKNYYVASEKRDRVKADMEEALALLEQSKATLEAKRHEEDILQSAKLYRQIQKADGKITGLKKLIEDKENHSDDAERIANLKYSVLVKAREAKSEQESIRAELEEKVWNISLGSNQEINDNFISAEAAVLDQIQYENDVIFVVAGTNKSREDVNKIGSPADSINSMVVNAVTKSGLSTKYSRKGLALSFFAKPDVSYYGGSEEQYIQVCEPLGATFVAGTSFAAPWIARKLAYLIDVLGLNREIAKALIIDAARGWNDAPTPEEVALYGHGIVPIKITDIIQTPEDEIRFLVTDVSEKWNTYNYHFPIPLKADTYPYYARATMCYFPLCDRAQGVDYTNTELNLHFGRIQDDGKLNEINDDKQNLDDIGESRSYILEGDARERFRKWDNVKYVAEKVKDRRVPKKSYRNKNWGMEIKTNNRLDPEDGVGLRFGVVVTIKEMYGINRIDEFIKNCNLNGWLVNAIDIQNRIEIHEKINEEIRFD